MPEPFAHLINAAFLYSESPGSCSSFRFELCKTLSSSEGWESISLVNMKIRSINYLDKLGFAHAVRTRIATEV